MRIAITGATGFLGRFIANRLLRAGHACRCWHRAASDRGGFFESAALSWVPGELGDRRAAAELVHGCEAVVHAALHHAGGGWRGATGTTAEFVTRNVVGTVDLIDAARAAGVERFVFISTCAVHDVVLRDRPLDEAHPLWPHSHYGAHKAAIEKFVHSYGLGHGYAICALRPTGIYGIARPIEDSKWFELIRDVAAGRPVRVERGGKEVHAEDVARATELLLRAPGEQIRGQAFNCYDRYISEYDVARIASERSGSASVIDGGPRSPQNQIDTTKLRTLGMTFGGEGLLRDYVDALLRHARA